MNDLTKGFRLFRELARVVWNCGLRMYPDGEHEFSFVEDALFTAMVASQAVQTLTERDADNITYYPQIGVLPTRQQLETALVGHVVPKGISWTADGLPSSADLRFSTLFDFDSLSGSYRDFRYVFCADVSEPPTTRLVLIDAHDVTLTEVSDEHATSSSLNQE